VVAFQKDGVTPTGTAAEWIKMTSKTTGHGASGASTFGQVNGSLCPTTVPGEKPFILNARTATVWNVTPAMSVPDGSLPPFAQVIYNSDSSINNAYGLWIEAVPSTNLDGPGFVDFHIRACWNSAGSAAPATLGTIVRLYEPR
jgi:hypothetical protein